jgi:hypothetical protein
MGSMILMRKRVRAFGSGPGLCRILDTNFGEHLFYEVGA